MRLLRRFAFRNDSGIPCEKETKCEGDNHAEIAREVVAIDNTAVCFCSEIAHQVKDTRQKTYEYNNG